MDRHTMAQLWAEKKRTPSRYLRRIVFSGVWITGLLLLVQILMLLLLFTRMGQYQNFLMEGLTMMGAGILIYIINEKSNPAYKIAWIIPIILFPLLGSLLYLYVKLNTGNIVPRSIFRRILEETREYGYTDEENLQALEGQDPMFAKMAAYLAQTGGYPAWQNTSVEYFALGDHVLEPLLSELKQARHYIFLEYFIIEEGIFWDQILEVLTEKVREGVEVRLMYDDFGCLAMLPRNYHKKLRRLGIDTIKVAALTPFLSTHFNNRDHRKMIIIDGVTVFSGGINLADEYINAYERFGHWKDNGFFLRGDAVYNYVLMFLQMWKASGGSGKRDCEAYLAPLRGRGCKTGTAGSRGGFVIPYGDGPYQGESIAVNVYLDIIYGATDYVYIMTPYLILDYQMQQALSHAARSGVDVRIIMPGIPDKKLPFYVARTYYPQLLEEGVKIYEYQKGFVHSKVFLSDDRMASIGTVNLDYRSLYLHYECAAVIYGNAELEAVKADFEDTFDKCREMTRAEYYKTPLRHRILGRICRMFGPLM